MAIKAERAAARPELLLQPRGIQQHGGVAFLAKVAECDAKGRVQPAQRHGLALCGCVDGEGLALYGGVGLAKVAEGGDDGEAGGVSEIAVEGEDVDVGADGPALLASDEAEGFGVEGAGAADRLLEQAGEEDLGLGWAVDFEGGSCHGAQLGGDGEDALEGSVCVRDGHFSGDFDEDSGGSSC